MKAIWRASAIVLVFVLSACGSSTSARPAASSISQSDDASGPVVGDHIHMAVGLSTCGTALANPVDAGEDRHGIHTHGDGLIHIHPFDTSVAGKHAILGAFLDDIGATTSESALSLPSRTSLPFSGSCSGQHAQLIIKRWRSTTDANPTVTRITTAAELRAIPLRTDGGVLAIALTDDPASVSLPQSASQLGSPSDSSPTIPPAGSPGSAAGQGTPPPAHGLVFAPVLGQAAPPCTNTAASAQDKGSCYELSPAVAVEIESARSSELTAGQWVVDLVLTDAGIQHFNQLAQECYAASAPCPTKRLAIVLDGVVESAPQIQAPSFQRDQIQIGGNFSENEARALASRLR